MPGLPLPRAVPLSDPEVRELLQKAQKGDDKARDRMVECNLRLVYSIAGRFAGRGRELEDLFQLGCIGLLKAIEKFDCNFNVKFSTYAVPVIIGEIRQFLRNDGPLKLSRSMREKGRQIRAFRENFIKEKGFEPTTMEIAEQFKIDQAEVAELIEVTRPVLSLFEVVSEGEGDPIYLIDQVRETPGAYENLDRMAVKQVLGSLSERFRLVLRLRFLEGKTQVEVAGILGVSQVQVCRLEKAALAKLREVLGGS
ncbi:MAG: SigB/SigF/SigG family RNA polymerase sigma factor [Bacillota bacterium]